MKKSPRQGDLLFVPRVNKIFLDVKTRKDFKKNGVIREGEATGHHHRVEDLTTADVFLPQNGMPVVNVHGLGAVITHPEHKPVKLEPDTTYDVHLAREADPLSNTVRTVVD